MKSSLSVTMPCALVPCFAAGAAQAQNFGPNDQRETWMESTRVQVWKNGYGECWHSAFGPPPPPSQCGAVVAQYVPPPAPIAAAPPPPPPRPVAVAPAPPPPVVVEPMRPRKKDRN